MTAPDAPGARTDAALDRASLLLKMGRPADAEREARSVLAADPDSVEAHYRLADALSRQGDTEGALDAINHCVAVKPEAWPVHSRAGVILQRAGRFHEAAAAFENALAHGPDDPRPYAALSWARRELGEWHAARDVAERGLRIDPENTALHIALGLALSKLGELPQARAHMEHALRLEPENGDIHRWYGEILLAIGENRAAADEFREALRLDPSWAEGRTMLWQAEMGRNRLFAVHNRLWGLRTRPRAQIGWWIVACILPPWFALMALLTVAMWVNWANITFTMLWLHRDPRRRGLVEPAWLYKTAAAALGTGAAMLVLGAVLQDGRTALLGLAVLALVTPIMEVATLDGARQILSMLLPAALAVWLAVLIPLAYFVDPHWTTPAAALVTFYLGLGSTWLSILLHRRNSVPRT